jgi:hypothetical protein
MRSRRLACVLLGIWMGGGLLVAWVAAANRRSAERVPVEANTAASLELRHMGPAARRLMHYQAAQQNRWLLSDWGMAQVALGGLLFLYLLFASREGKRSLLLALVMVVAAALERTLLTPEMAASGRALDFPDSLELASESGRLAAFSALYLTVLAVQWAAGLWLAGRLVLPRRGGLGDVRDQIDPVDKADHRRVNR